MSRTPSTGGTRPRRSRGASTRSAPPLEEQRQGETLEQRIEQEVPDPASAYGAPDNESGLDNEDDDRVGGDDPDSIAAEDDFIGDAEVGDERAGRLVAPDEGSPRGHGRRDGRA